MLPKPEKKSFSKSGEQLDLVETISDADRLQKKRRYLLISLFLTIGLSLCFWLYRQSKLISLPSLNIPDISINIPKQSDKFSLDLPSDWSFSLVASDSSSFSYTSNFDPATSFSQITKINPSPFAKKSLPDGVTVVEKTNSTSNYSEILSQISTPKIKFQIYAKFPGSLTSASTDLYSQFAESSYWYLMDSSN